MNSNGLTRFSQQLVSLLLRKSKEAGLPKLDECYKEEVPYGWKISWALGELPFFIHMKDNHKVKQKKRWSQVMYMNYVLKHRSKKWDHENTFILTTDADVQFTPESVSSLLDILISNPKVGAVSNRTHPKGSGPLYWYQIFDYAVGHWLLKPAEHILGCVLCCPGCFSMFRCEALESILDAYSSEVAGALEFLEKDMGEDRWLCTLLIQKGWQLEYCAISENFTNCPQSFNEFYKQRRRWISSTLANLYLLITQAVSITEANDSVTMLFILYQCLIMFGTLISPATVILIITSGLATLYEMPDSDQIVLIVVLSLLSVGYGLLCLYTQRMDIAIFLTIVFSLIMFVGIVGIILDKINDIFKLSDYVPLI